MSVHTSAGPPAQPPLEVRRPTGVGLDGLLLLVPVILYAAAFVTLIGLTAAHAIDRLTAALPGVQ